LIDLYQFGNGVICYHYRLEKKLDSWKLEDMRWTWSRPSMYRDFGGIKRGMESKRGVEMVSEDNSAKFDLWGGQDKNEDTTIKAMTPD